MGKQEKELTAIEAYEKLKTEMYSKKTFQSEETGMCFYAAPVMRLLNGIELILQQTNKEIEDLKNNSVHREIYNDLSSINDFGTKCLKEKERTISELQSQLNAANKEIEKLKDTELKIINVCNDYETDINDLKEKLTDRDNEIKTLIEKNETSQMRILIPLAQIETFVNDESASVYEKYMQIKAIMIEFNNQK